MSTLHDVNTKSQCNLILNHFESDNSRYENLSKAELDEIIKFGFTKHGFEKFKKAYLKAKELLCQQQK